jgi:hypothetical protein
MRRKETAINRPESIWSGDGICDMRLAFAVGSGG